MGSRGYSRARPTVVLESPHFLGDMEEPTDPELPQSMAHHIMDDVDERKPIIVSL